MNSRIYYTAAHAEFPDSEPLGGGKAIADYLIREWRRTSPFDLTVLSPRAVGIVTGSAPPPGAERVSVPHSLTAHSELQYARFCRDFERRITNQLLAVDPAGSVVLSNDISEGPDFAALAAHGHRIVTIFHVDVVEYFTRFYLRGWIRPERLTGWRSYRWLPDVLRLVFQKQRDCVAHSQRLIVPSAPMKDTIRRCYPWYPADRIIVLPWGNIASNSSLCSARVSDPADPPTAGLPSVAPTDFVILTLSRLSPEKGIERLLAALPFVSGNIRVWICGAPAYMQGRTYERKLRRLAAGDQRVEFLGHVTGDHKAALLRRADLFISPSIHESYGLTIAEAQAAGCRIISHHHYGATGTVVDCANPHGLADAISQLVCSGRTDKSDVVARASDAAERLAKILAEVRGPE